MMDCIIEWNNLSPAQWEEHFCRIRRASLLQSYDYARAACPLYRQKARWGLIKINGQPAGLVQLLEAGLFGNIVHALTLDLGPLWFEGFGSASHIDAFYRAFNVMFPRRFGRRRRIIPATIETPSGRALFKNMGYERLDTPGYQTIWLDLTQDIDVLRAGLHKKWRNILNKAEKAGLEIQWDETGKLFPSLLTFYKEDKAKKGYDGPSGELLKSLAASFGSKGLMITGQARLDNKPVAAVLLFCHGVSATYQIGWSAEEGRKTGAHNLLLWQAMALLKEKGFKDFDLGGINDDDAAQGVKKFKQGLGGETICYLGHYL